MSSQQSAAPAHVAKEIKPSLAGVRNKQRKGVVKAAAKFEPEEFRDQLLKHLSTLPPGDLDAVSTKLEALGNQLDFRKYEGPLFELLLVGALLAPGGSFVLDNAEKSPFSILTSTKAPVEVSDMKKHVDVFNRLIRRYKYLQKLFEENALTEILQYANKWKDDDLEKLTFATALFIATGLASSSILLTLQRENLVRDGVSLAFVTKVFKAYLLVESGDHLSSNLRRGGVTNLAAFFPVQKNEPADVEAHFKSEKLEPLVVFLQKQRGAKIREETLARLKEMLDAGEPQPDIISYLKGQYKTGGMPDTDFVALVWQGLTDHVDTSARPDQIGDMLVREVTAISPTLEVFCTTARSEVALINTIQIWAYENTKLMGQFARILKTLYGKDVVSDAAVLFWHAKGSRPQGRQHFLKSTEPLVKFLKEQEADESDDE